jgi:hypothetical protein
METKNGLILFSRNLEANYTTRNSNNFWTTLSMGTKIMSYSIKCSTELELLQHKFNSYSMFVLVIYLLEAIPLEDKVFCLWGIDALFVWNLFQHI